MEDFDNPQKSVDSTAPELGKFGEEEQELDVEAPLRERIPEKLRSRLEEMNIGHKLVQAWDSGNADRKEQLERQRAITESLDEFVEPLYTPPQEWMSDLHIPTSFMVCKVFHARMYEAMLGQDPPFQVKSRTEANMNRAEMVQNVLNYTLKDWANNNQGVKDVLDKFLWDWCTSGDGYLKMRWDKRFTRFVDVEERQETVPGPSIGGEQGPDEVVTKEVPVKKDLEFFNGPVWEEVPKEDLLIVGGDGDPDNADLVCQQLYLSAHELNTLAHQKLFNKKAVDRVISGGENRESEEPVNAIKQDRAQTSGENSVDEQTVEDRYQILEGYIKVSLDESGIDSDVVVWVHKDTHEILRATYLYRIMETGLKPYAHAYFHKRRGQTAGVGLPELIYSLSQEMDAMHNLKVDFGLISTMPFGFYRASSSLRDERLPLSPGELIPVTDPSRDINIPNIGNRSSFAAGEEQALFNIISRVTGLGDLQFGVIGGQGPTRTATGTRALVNESNANLNIFLLRINRAFKKALKYTHYMLLRKLPEGLEFRITGEDGNQYYNQVRSREEIKGSYDFELEPNSANSNPQVKAAKASQTLQLVQNPLMLQLGIVSPKNLFDAAKDFLQNNGVKDWSKYLTAPQNIPRIFTPVEIANRVLAGIDVQLDPQQDIDGFIEWVQDFINNDESMGQFEQQDIIRLVAKMREAQGIQQALRQAQAQAQNIQQIQQNAGLTTQAGPVGEAPTGPEEV